MKYDLHIHTHHSRCSNLKPEVILKKAKSKGLNGIAITDHNSIKGAFEVKKLNKNKKFEVIIGEEIKTNKGEILALYLKKEIKPGDFYKVLKQIKKQKAIAIIAHPYSVIEFGRKKADKEVFKSIDAVEGFNARSLFEFENLRAQIKAKELNLPITAGSDAHFAFEIGRAYTEFRGNLRTAIKNKTTKIHGSHILALPARILTSFQKHVFYHLTSLNLK